MEDPNPNPKPLLLLLLLPTTLSFASVSALDFVFNGFNSSSSLLLRGNVTIENRILTLTNDTTFSIGRALYKSKVQTKTPNSAFVLPFSTSFIFSIAPYENTLPGNGLAFIIVPFTGISDYSYVQYLGFLTRTDEGKNNIMFGVEFDVFKNEEFNDTNDNHVGIDVNSLKSMKAHEAGYWPDGSNGTEEYLFKKLKLNSGENYQVRIDYNNSVLNVTMIRPARKG